MKQDHIMRLADQAAPTVLAEAHAEGFENMAIGGAYRLAYAAFASLLLPDAKTEEGPDGR